MKRFVIAATLAVVLVPPVTAQQAAAPVPTVAMPTTAEGFRRMAMMSDAFEIQSSRLALEKSRNGIVRRFANEMIRDHSMTTQALMGGAPAASAAGTMGGAATGAVVGGVVGGPVGAAVGAGVGAGAGAAGAPATTGSMPAAGLDARHAAMLQQLAAAPQGRAFDRLYGDMQRQAHSEAVAVFTAYAQQGGDPNMRAFAQQTLPHLQRHLARARSLPGAR
jgi:predicted outer membrane protein